MHKQRIGRVCAVVALVGLSLPSGGCLWYALGKNAGKRDARQQADQAERRRLEQRVRELEADQAGEIPARADQAGGGA